MLSLRDLELRHLAALDAVATEGTFGRAAVRLGYTQSAVSQQIAGLERLVGGAVFDRPGGPRPVELTPLGKLVLGHARDILARVDAAGDAVERFRAGESGRIDVGTFQSVSNVLLPAIVQRLRLDHPGVDIRLFEHDDKDTVINLVRAGELDVAFGVGGPPDLDAVVLLDDPYVLVAPAGDLPDGAYPTRQLDGVAMIGYPPSACQGDVDDGLRAAGATPTYVFRTYDNGAQVAMVKAGIGWAVMPLLAVDTRDPDIAIRSLSPPVPPRQVTLLWRRDRTLSPVSSRLIELAVDVAAGPRELPVSA